MSTEPRFVFSCARSKALKSSKKPINKSMPDLNSGDYVITEIADNGVGIESENLNYIFDPFFTTKPIGEGLGLGLNVASMIASAHNGTITADSNRNKGTKVSIYLPLAKQKGF